MREGDKNSHETIEGEQREQQPPVNTVAEPPISSFSKLLPNS
jgi:hypothetical protein